LHILISLNQKARDLRSQPALIDEEVIRTWIADAANSFIAVTVAIRWKTWLVSVLMVKLVKVITYLEMSTVALELGPQELMLRSRGEVRMTQCAAIPDAVLQSLV
jgi:hypothetical protein